MLYIKSLEQAVPVFKALGSDIRIRLIQTLLEHQEMNMNELASSLGITNGALTSHVKKLEESGILAILPEHSGHGNQKVCRINVDKILVDIASNNASPAEDSYSIDIPIGNYFNYSVYPTCGLSTTDNLIGEVDDPRYFAHPSHVDAKILWFGRGFIDYRIPNMLPPGQKIDRLTLSFEISSEAPGVNSDWPSDISFFLNNTKVGTWTSPGLPAGGGVIHLAGAYQRDLLGVPAAFSAGGGDPLTDLLNICLNGHRTSLSFFMKQLFRHTDPVRQR